MPETSNRKSTSSDPSTNLEDLSKSSFGGAEVDADPSFLEQVRETISAIGEGLSEALEDCTAWVDDPMGWIDDPFSTEQFFNPLNPFSPF